MLTETKLDTISAIRNRRAIRSYGPERLEKHVVEELIDAAIQAPTAVHREPWAFAVIQNRERLRKYSDEAKALLLAQQQATSFFEGHEPQALAVLSDPEFNIFYDAGTLIVIGCTAGGPFVEADCWLAAENLMLAATAKGYGTCCIGFAVGILNTPDVKRELGIPEAGAAVAPIIVGVPKGPLPAGVRKPPVILSWLS
ncbi:nitroreductase family protein [Bradyrhizobium sp. BR 10289]|uniref:nitroreductase family protein n=1 Tax=Bradyrhizobium sp. BR 10289 TaxID=2749993 RepID=UPI001C64BF5E|nr:nitroreductase family protein [Bradyrhizobium sp. BR 10289]MBW7973846.1 nitroreductase family protein [Bradyrhizobium sp. BR 10289]